MFTAGSVEGSVKMKFTQKSNKFKKFEWRKNKKLILAYQVATRVLC